MQAERKVCKLRDKRAGGLRCRRCRTELRLIAENRNMTKRRFLSLSLSLAIAGLIIVPIDSYQVSAEQAATSPTCTGCSGSQTKRSREAKPRPQKAHRERNVSSARPGGGLASYNGTWAGLSTGHCIPNYNWTIDVNNGVVSGSSTSGSVTGAGFVRASMMVNGYRYDVVGHARGSTASGTWTTTGNCAGRWTATRS